jgi:hypothetical protein
VAEVAQLLDADGGLAFPSLPGMYKLTHDYRMRMSHRHLHRGVRRAAPRHQDVKHGHVWPWFRQAIESVDAVGRDLDADALGVEHPAAGLAQTLDSRLGGTQ